MVGGRMIDLIAEKRRLDIGAITRLQRMKTGALIAYACEAGAVLAKAAPELRTALRGYAHDLGLAFQIADEDRKSTRLNSSHVSISYAVFCLKKKKQNRLMRPYRQ